MQMHNNGKISDLVGRQRAYFESGATRSLDFRAAMLDKLRAALLKHQDALMAALKADLGKSETEAYMCEFGLVLSDLRYVRRRFRRWSRTERVPTPLAHFPARSSIIREPYGVALIMSPWNYPLLLTIEPLVGAIAAGNCAVLKPSAYSPATSAVMAEMIRDTFANEYIAVVEGGREENSSLLDCRFDYVFFTGGVTVGREVMRRAAEHLTPVTLELGGKSPCIVDSTADIALTARRIVFGKYLNCGQTCVAPDYLLVHSSVKTELIDAIKQEIVRQYGADPLSEPDYGKIINRRHFDRLLALIDRDKVVHGGAVNPETLQIAPIILDKVSPDDPVMQEEIFGPILPIIEFDDIDEAYSFIAARSHPLALYIFTRNSAVESRFVSGLSFGGGCVNDTMVHLASSYMPFGGVGQSGMGAYHGKMSYATFSRTKSILKKSLLIDLFVRYRPYSKIKNSIIRVFLH